MGFPGVLVILGILLLFSRTFADLADKIRDEFRNGPRGGPPTHPLPVTGKVEISGVKNRSASADE